MGDNENSIKEKAEQLIKDAAAIGMDVTIERQPQQPLAMGNHKLVVFVAPKAPY